MQVSHELLCEISRIQVTWICQEFSVSYFPSDRLQYKDGMMMTDNEEEENNLSRASVKTVMMQGDSL